MGHSAGFLFQKRSSYNTSTLFFWKLISIASFRFCVISGTTDFDLESLITKIEYNYNSFGVTQQNIHSFQNFQLIGLEILVYIYKPFRVPCFVFKAYEMATSELKMYSMVTKIFNERSFCLKIQIIHFGNQTSDNNISASRYHT